MSPFSVSDLTVCGIDELPGHQSRGVTHVLSILDPEWPDPEAFRAFSPHFRAIFRFHDVIEPGPGAPEKADVEKILAFGRDAGPDLRHLLIHCHAGVSRSTAAMLMLLAQAHPEQGETELVDRLTGIRPQAWPNSRMIGFADAALGRGGRLTAAVSQIYARRVRAEPKLIDIMRGLNRSREVDIGLALNPAEAAT
jgi:predicted protein tyrosine phosphatase